MTRRLAALVAMALISCGGGSGECGAAECADVCARAPEAAAPSPTAAPKAAEPDQVALSDFENQLFGPLLDDVRKGVRPLNEKGLGICVGQSKDCTEFVGASPGELPAGSYSIQAHLAVPRTGEKGTWKVRFETKCETIRQGPNGETRTPSDYAKEYDVVYAGEDRPYSLAPLRRIESPNKTGRQECTYTLTAPQPGGDKVYTGAWAVPAL
jgi:hypothetical protein